MGVIFRIETVQGMRYWDYGISENLGRDDWISEESFLGPSMLWRNYVLVSEKSRTLKPGECGTLAGDFSGFRP